MDLACDTTNSSGTIHCTNNASDGAATALVLVGTVIGIVFGIYQFLQTKAIEIPETEEASKAIRDEANNATEEETSGLTGDEEKEDKMVTQEMFTELKTIYGFVQEGAASFLKAQYGICAIFTVVFSIVILILCSSTSKLSDDKTKTEHSWDWGVGALTATSFIVGAFNSILSGYIGMTVAVFANARVTVAAVRPGAAGWRASFNAAFIAGSVMGFALCGLALGVLFILINIFCQFDGYSMDTGAGAKKLFEAIAGYGLGGSSMALFGRVGGGIFTKAADVGADLSGKVVGVTRYDQQTDTYYQQEIDEDSPYNPATIADNVGDNVGDVAGMGSDLFGSFAEASCAALVISASSPEIADLGFSAYMFPLLVSACGIVVCMLTSFVATHIQRVASHTDVEGVLKVQLFVSALLMTGATLPCALYFLPNKFRFNDLYEVKPGSSYELQDCHNWGAWVCVVCGLWGGCIIGFVTEYYTSHSYKPVQEVSQSCESGAATNIIYGLALGYLSCIIPITLLAINVYVSFALCGMYGVSLAALGMLGTLATCLSIDVYGPIADNAGGLAEMSEFPSFVRDKTDALDAAGNTTAAIGKGFAIGSAALVSLALFGGFVSRLAGHSNLIKLEDDSYVQAEVTINVLRPVTFAFLFLGAMLPYWFTAFCMKSVGEAAKMMVQNVKEQFQGENGRMIWDKEIKPDYDACISISTNASLREMIPPALLVILSPLLTGTFFGVEAVSGLLVGALISAVQLAISQSNSGGAWDNAKKYVEKGEVKVKVFITQSYAREHPEYEQEVGRELEIVQGKKTDLHKAAVIGDTVGDPLKDTSGPALNIVMKLMAILSLVFSDFFVSINHGRGVLKVPTSLDLACTADAQCPTH
jgi:inorganic pyrophosphatase